MVAQPVVLVIDDEPALGELMRTAVARWNGDVSVASNAIEALAFLNSLKPDLILLDIMMPGLDGLELCRMLRQREDTANTYILIISARRDMETVGEALESGASDFWAKPLDYDRMVDLRELLEKIMAESSDE